VKLSVTVPADTVDKAIATTYKRIANEVKIPGFRQGHAPPRVVDNLVGRERVMVEVQEVIVNETYPAALDSEDLRPIEEPDMGELDLPEEGEPYSYEAEVAVRPELTLSEYEGITVTVPPSEVTDEDVDAEIENLRDRLATLEEVDRGIESGDFATVSFDGRVDGEDFEGGTVENYLYEFGAGRMPDEFEEQLTGAHAGDERHVAFTIREGTANHEYVGKEATFDVTVHEVKAKALPEVDDEFALAAGGYDSVDDMRAQLREQAQQRKTAEHMRRVEVEARRALLANLDEDVPQAMVSRRTDEMVRDFFNRLESQGITPEQYSRQTGDDLETLSKEIEVMARESVATDLALEALFRALDLELTEDDVDAEMIEMAGGEGDPAEMRARFEEAGLIKVVQEQAMHRKATMWLLENVTVIESEDADERAPRAHAPDDATDEDEPDDTDADASGEE
jgi:trigger factor